MGEGVPGRTCQEVGPFTLGKLFSHLVALHFLFCLRPARVLMAMEGPDTRVPSSP